MNLDLRKMTTEEKIRTMELLWDDICHVVPNFSSPDWHGDILKERAERVKQGKDTFEDWEQVKKEIRDSVSCK